MKLHVLPHREDSAAGNMAADLLLLQRWPGPPHPRFRHYGWREPAFTFGLSQAIAWVRERLPQGRLDLCRRPSGGGLVDHRDDWTYTVVIPRGHALEEAPARESYRTIHLCLAGALNAAGADVRLQPPPDETHTHAPDVCFVRAEPWDIVTGPAGRKVAGAAQKRNRHGLLLQGSVDRRSLPGSIDWLAVQGAFVSQLARELDADPGESPWPAFPEGEEDALRDLYASAEWIERR